MAASTDLWASFLFCGPKGSMLPCSGIKTWTVYLVRKIELFLVWHRPSPWPLLPPRSLKLWRTFLENRQGQLFILYAQPVTVKNEDLTPCPYIRSHPYPDKATALYLVPDGMVWLLALGHGLVLISWVISTTSPIRQNKFWSSFEVIFT